MGVVYKINFPDGRFYIGAAEDFGTRIYSHWTGRGYVSKAAREFFAYKEYLSECSYVMYRGDSYKEVEKKMIYKSRDNPLMMNKKIVDPDKIKPKVTTLMKLRKVPEFSNDTVKDIKIYARCLIRRDLRRADPNLTDRNIRVRAYAMKKEELYLYLLEKFTIDKGE